MNILERKPYSNDPYTANYGTDRIRQALGERYGERYFKYREDWNRAGFNWLPDYPINLVLDLVDKCNLACPQCLRAPDLIKDYGGFIGTKKYLATETIIKILHESKEYNLPSVNIGGSGECTLASGLHQDLRRGDEDRSVRIPHHHQRPSPAGRYRDRDGRSRRAYALDLDRRHEPAELRRRHAASHIVIQQVVDNAVAFAELKAKRNAKLPLLRVSFVEQDGNRHERDEFIRFWSDYADMIDVQAFHNFRQSEGFDETFECDEPFKRITVWAYGGAGPVLRLPGHRLQCRRLREAHASTTSGMARKSSASAP